MNIAGFCLPMSKSDLRKGTGLVLGYDALRNTIKNSAGGKTASDIIKSLPSIYYSIGTGIIYSFLFLYLMSAYA